MLRQLTRVRTTIDKVFVTIAGLGLCAMMVHTVANVLATQLFDKPIDSTLDVVAYYYMITVVFFALGVLVNRPGGLVRVDLLETYMSQTMTSVTLALGYAATALFAGWAAVVGWHAGVDAYEVKAYVGSLFQLQIWPLRFVLVIGCSWLCLTALLRLVEEMVQVGKQ